MTSIDEIAAVPARRDAERTRQRIISAAHEEFVARGMAGARVSEIARRAGVNVRMLYYYFQDKDALYLAVLTQLLARMPSSSEVGLPLDQQIENVYLYCAANPDWVRLSQWEALEYGGKPAVDGEERRSLWSLMVEVVRRDQKAGKIDPSFDPEMFVLGVFALSSFPIAFGPMARMTTGLDPLSPAFQQRYGDFLRMVGRRLLPGAG